MKKLETFLLFIQCFLSYERFLKRRFYAFRRTHWSYLINVPATKQLTIFNYHLILSTSVLVVWINQYRCISVCYMSLRNINFDPDKINLLLPVWLRLIIILYRWKEHLFIPTKKTFSLLYSNPLPKILFRLLRHKIKVRVETVVRCLMAVKSVVILKIERALQQGSCWLFVLIGPSLKARTIKAWIKLASLKTYCEFIFRSSKYWSYNERVIK